MLRKKTLEALTQKKKKKKTKKESRGIEEEDKNFEEHCSNSFLFLRKNYF